MCVCVLCMCVLRVCVLCVCVCARTCMCIAHHAFCKCNMHVCKRTLLFLQALHCQYAYSCLAVFMRIINYCHSFIINYCHSFIINYCHSFIINYCHSFIINYCHSFIINYCHSFIINYCHSFIINYCHSFIHSSGQAFLRFSASIQHTRKQPTVLLCGSGEDQEMFILTMDFFWRFFSVTMVRILSRRKKKKMQVRATRPFHTASR